MAPYFFLYTHISPLKKYCAIITTPKRKIVITYCEKILSFNWPQICSKSLPDSRRILPDFYWIVFKQFCPKNPPFSVISSKISIFVILCDFTEFLPKQEIDLF